MVIEKILEFSQISDTIIFWQTYTNGKQCSKIDSTGGPSAVECSYAAPNCPSRPIINWMNTKQAYYKTILLLQAVYETESHDHGLFMNSSRTWNGIVCEIQLHGFDSRNLRSLNSVHETQDSWIFHKLKFMTWWCMNI